MTRTRYIMLYIAVGLAAVTANAQIKGAGSSVYNFMNLPVSARLNALGGENVAIQDGDISMAFMNPAAPPFSRSTGNDPASFNAQPMILWSNSSFLHMKCTLRLVISMTAAVSKTCVWLHTSSTGPSFGIFSFPMGLKRHQRKQMIPPKNRRKRYIFYPSICPVMAMSRETVSSMESVSVLTSMASSAT